MGSFRPRKTSNDSVSVNDSEVSESVSSRSPRGGSKANRRRLNRTKSFATRTESASPSPRYSPAPIGDITGSIPRNGFHPGSNPYDTAQQLIALQSKCKVLE